MNFKRRIEKCANMDDIYIDGFLSLLDYLMLCCVRILYYFYNFIHND